MARNSLLFLVTLIVALTSFQKSNATAFDIGWGLWSGWPPHSWIERQDVRIGDKVEFYYDPDYDNVLQVTRESFQLCDRSNPIATWSEETGGLAVFHVTEYGHFYFISGKSHNCERGQRVHVYVRNPYSPGPRPVASATSPSRSNTPTPSPSSSPPTPSGISSSLYFLFQRFGH